MEKKEQEKKEYIAPTMELIACKNDFNLLQDSPPDSPPDQANVIWD